MNFRIADTFTDSLGRLTGDEQKAVKTTAFDLQINPANPGMSFHKLDKARDKNFWSVRVSRDIRLIVHRTPQSLLLCYVDHHDDAYHWAECRKIETHPKTGAAQIVEIRERIQEILVQKVVSMGACEVVVTPLFDGVTDSDLLSWGVPTEWLPDVHRIASEDALLSLTDHLPAEAAEALIEFVTGGRPEPLPLAAFLDDEAFGDRALPAASIVVSDDDGLDNIFCPEAVERSDDVDDLDSSADPFAHPDAQRRFRTIQSVEELARALDAPWDKWTIFLHPDQQEWVEKSFNGPARVSGSAGTGKTIVALHRAAHLAQKNPDARVLLTTFSDALANALRTKLRRLIGNQPHLAERIDVYSIDSIARRLYEQQSGNPQLVAREDILRLIFETASAHPGHGFEVGFLISEWHQVVDAWQLDSWQGYRDVQRLGRRTRLPESRRKVLWDIYAEVLAKLNALGKTTSAGMYARLARELDQREQPPFEFAVIDEAQDVSVVQLRFLAAIAGRRPNGLFFAGDHGQRIFQQPFSWKSQGVDIRGRSRTLRINYRMSHQIRTQADRLLDPEIADVDGNIERRSNTVSAFNGPAPEIRTFDDPSGETNAVGEWLQARINEAVPPAEIAVFVRSPTELLRAKDAVNASGFEGQVLDERLRVEPGKIVISTMHLAKGLEFRAVVVMACDDEIIPSQERLSSVVDQAELEEVYNTERQLLYVACTRARDRLMVSGVQPVSEFLADVAGNE